MKEFYSMTIDQALSETQSNKKGLSEKEASGRLSLSADKHILPSLFLKNWVSSSRIL